MGPRGAHPFSGWAHVGGPKPKFWDPKNKKNKNSQNQNPFCPKCREYFFKPEKNLPGPIWGPPGPFFAWAGKIQKIQKLCLFSLVGQWAFDRWTVMGVEMLALKRRSHPTFLTCQSKNNESLNMPPHNAVRKTPGPRPEPKPGPGHILEIWEPGNPQI